MHISLYQVSIRGVAVEVLEAAERKKDGKQKGVMLS